jgi:hypothetical protein
MFQSKPVDAAALRGKVMTRKEPVRRLKALRDLFDLGTKC